MIREKISDVRFGYDLVADEYARSWESGAALEFYFFRVETVAGYFRRAGFEIEEIIEREPYAPEVEYQSRRAYIFARKPKATIASA